MKHVNSCHYEVVVCVKTKDGNCAFCKSQFQSSVHPSSITSSDPRKLYREKVNYNSNHDIKTGKIMKSNNRYYKDEMYKESKKFNNAKYKTNEQFKEKVKNIDYKYKSNNVHCEAVKNYSILKYSTDEAHKQSVKRTVLRSIIRMNYTESL